MRTWQTAAFFCKNAVLLSYTTTVSYIKTGAKQTFFHFFKRPVTTTPVQLAIKLISLQMYKRVFSAT